MLRIIPGYTAHDVLYTASEQPEGVTPREFAGEGYTAPLPSAYNALKRLTAVGLLRREGRRYYITPEGLEVLSKLPLDIFDEVKLDYWPHTTHRRKKGLKSVQIPE